MLGVTFVGYLVPSPYNYHNWLSKIAALNPIFLKSAKLKVKLGMQKSLFVFLWEVSSWLVVSQDQSAFSALSNLHAGRGEGWKFNVSCFPRLFDSL